MNPATSNARVLVAELVRHGVRHVVLAPGSRSAPLAFALSAAADRDEIRLHVRIDERVAAFTALGLARVTGLSAVVTTSGTAVANLHPAILEAAHAAVPLLALTADRPFEVRGTGANQTTEQAGIFGVAARWTADVPAPVGRPGEAADLRAMVARAVAAARGVRTGHPGPVQLNLAYREPLAPGATATAGVDAASDPVTPGLVTADPLTAVLESGRGSVWTVPPGPRTVVLAGDRAGPAARQVAEDGGFPLLAEPSSGARVGRCVVGPYRLLLGRPELGGRIERVLVFGHPTLATEPGRAVHTLLTSDDVEVVIVAGNRPDWPDPGRRARRVVSAARVAQPDDGGEWLQCWQAAGAAAQKAVDRELAAQPLSGPLVAAEVAAATGAGQWLVVGASNPIRDMDLAAAPFDPDAVPVVAANRGLSGIDGTISTASGIALATGATTNVLVGDLTFLHDIGGLLVGPLEQRPPLRVTVLNDDGGGVFSLVEHGGPEYAQHFERVFGTPHGADLAALCAGFGVHHTRVTDLGGLRAALRRPPADDVAAGESAGVSVIEVQTDRAGLRDLHARIEAAVRSAL